MVKKIMICFDGTCNHPSDAKQEREWFGHGDYEDNGITNILKMHILFGGNLSNDKQAIANQHSFYYSGVGTYGSKIQKIFNAGFSPNNMDVRTIIKSAGHDLKENYKEGDQIYIFGFSRGAAIARRFASVIENYIEISGADQKPIEFLGVFDTVASIGFPNLNDVEKPQSDVIFEDHYVSKFIKKALHLVSADERRTAFLPTLMNQESRVTEVWFSGAHADVGGGFWFDGLSDVTLKFMQSQLEQIDIETLGLDEIDYASLVAKDGSYNIDEDDLLIKPNIAGKSHQQDRFAPIAKMTLSTRSIRVNIDDEPSTDGIPLIHESMVKRMKKLYDYRPRSLKGVLHNVVDDAGVTILEGSRGVNPHIQDLEDVA